MRNRVFLISLAVVLAISVGLVGCGGDGGGPAPSDKIVIGMSRSLHGSLAVLHTYAFGAIYPIYIEMLNDAGGITVDGTSFTVEAKVLDDDSNESKMVVNTNTLINDIKAGEVHFLFGSTGPDFIAVQAPIANAAGVVLMTFDGSATFLKINPGCLPRWPYIFISLSSADWNQLPVLAPLLTSNGYDDGDGDAADTAYICWQDDACGLEYLAAAAQFFPASGISIVGSMPINANDPKFNPITTLTAINATVPYPDVVCCFCYPSEVMGLTGAAIALNYNFDAWVTALAGNFGWFGAPQTQGLGDLAEGIICFAPANNKTSQPMASLFNDVLTPALGFDGLDFWGHPLYWAAMQMWQDAVEEVGQVVGGKFVIDQDDFRNQLASYCDAGSGVATVLGTTWYHMFGANATGGGILDYYCHTGEIGQWQDGYVEIVGYTGIKDDLPNYVVTANFTYPKPPWP
jgi:ABC-type branched-subunit amino acid transport system substrate-binding protein